MSIVRKSCNGEGLELLTSETAMEDQTEVHGLVDKISVVKNEIVKMPTLCTSADTCENFRDLKSEIYRVHILNIVYTAGKGRRGHNHPTAKKVFIRHEEDTEDACVEGTGQTWLKSKKKKHEKKKKRFNIKAK